MAAVTLEQVVQHMRDAIGDSLRAVVLYGSAVAGEHFARRSDLNVLVVVDALPFSVLRALGPATRDWIGAGNPPPLIFTTEEWQTSSDVFPMEYADILERHRVLYGELPAAGAGVTPANLRLQLEQDARGKLLHLRQAFAAAGTDHRIVLQILEQTLSKLMILYRALLRLHGERPPQDYEELARSAAGRAGFDEAAALRVVRHVRGSERIAVRDAERAAEDYLAAMEQFVRHLDSVPHT